jgi:hypothetical protein
LEIGTPKPGIDPSNHLRKSLSQNLPTGRSARPTVEVLGEALSGFFGNFQKIELCDDTILARNSDLIGDRPSLAIMTVSTCRRLPVFWPRVPVTTKEKLMIRRFLSPLLAVVLLAGYARAGEMVPFKGQLEYPAFSLGVPAPNVQCGFYESGQPVIAVPIQGKAEGTATHVGKFTETSDVTLCLIDGGRYFGTYTWEIASGDTIDFSFTGRELGRSDDNASDIAEYESTILRGTGRFENANGTLYSRQIRPDTGGAFGSFSGTISSVGSASSPRAVPEPSSMVLLGLGMFGLRRVCTCKRLGRAG